MKYTRSLIPFLGAALLLLSSGCQERGLDYPFTPLNELAAEQDHELLTMETLLHENIVSLLDRAESLEIFRVDMRPFYDEETEETSSRLELEAGPFPVENEFRQRFLHKIQDIDQFGIPVDCPFEPQLLFRVKAPVEKEDDSDEPVTDQIDFIVNLSCAEVVFVYRGVRVNPRNLTISHDFFRLVAAIAEESFPHDHELRGLSEL